jgi:hypothetical protein
MDPVKGGGGMDIPDGFEKVEAKVFRRGDELIVVGILDPEGPFAIHVKLSQQEAEEDFGPAPDGYEWTGEVRPPRKGEYFWSDIRGRVVQAVKDESGVNQFGESTGGRKILRPLARPMRPNLRLVKNEED